MTEEKAIVVAKPLGIIASMGDAERAAMAMAKSGYFTDSREANQALVKIMAGQELGFGPFASMTGIHIIQGKPAFGANILAAAVKGSGRYDYQVAELTDTACELHFYRGKSKLGVSRFTLDDAKRAGTQNLGKFPKNMLFARAISNGVKWYCPDIFMGAPVYTPDELGAEVDENGEVVNTTFVEAKPEPQAEPEEMTFERACTYTRNKDGVEYGDIDTPELMKMQEAIKKAPKSDVNDEKIEAINVIMQHRASFAVTVEPETDEA